MPRDHVATVRALFEAFNRRDVETMLELVHPDMDFLPMTARVIDRPEPYRGHEGMRQYMQDAAEVWDEVRITPTDVNAAGDAVVALGRTYVRGRSGVIDSSTCWVLKLRNGLVVHGRVFADEAEARAAAGVPSSTLEG